MADDRRRETGGTSIPDYFRVLHSLLREDIVHVRVKATGREWVGLVVAWTISHILLNAALACLAAHLAFITAGGD